MDLEPLVWLVSLALVPALIGGYWDVAWHIDFGRDTFWSPPHLAIYAAVLVLTIAFFGNLIAAIQKNLWRNERKTFILLLLGMGSVILQYIAAPLDILWHRLFGVDVTILSPPHLLLIFGGVTSTAIALLLAEKKYLKYILMGGVAAGIIFIFAEGAFATLPIWHPAKSRPAWLQSSLEILLPSFAFIGAKYLIPHKWSAAIVSINYIILRFIPIVFLNIIHMQSVPTMPPAVILFIISITLDIIWTQKQNLKKFLSS